MRLTLNHLISLTIGIICLGITVLVGRVAMETIQTALSLDETLSTVTSPTLNQALIEKALKTLQPQTQP